MDLSYRTNGMRKLMAVDKQSLTLEESIEINAAAETVFELLVDIERRMQLHPTWGKTSIAHIDSAYPSAGSFYQLNSSKEQQPTYKVQITRHIPAREFAYLILDDSQASVTWLLEPSSQGVRLTCSQQLMMEPDEPSPEIQPQVQTPEDELFSEPSLTREQMLERHTREWLTNIKRYAELGDSRIQRWMKWTLDRYVLKLRADQRRVIVVLIGLQLVACVTFLVAATGLGLAGVVLGR